MWKGDSPDINVRRISRVPGPAGPRCTAGKGEAGFAAFLNAWKQAYAIPDLGPPVRPSIVPPFNAAPAISRMV